MIILARAGPAHVCARFIVAVLFLFLVPCGAAVADGVTLFVHGWNPELAGTPQWMGSMREAIADTFLEGETNYATITITDDGGLTATCDPWDFDLAAGTTGELLIIVDWTDVADHLTGGPPSQDVAALVVQCLITGQNGRAPVAELPIHLIGHSRGGGMVCEIAHLLGEYGVVVDHLTPLDPHPLTAADPQPFPPADPVIDAPAKVYENVVFADAFVQLAEYPEGEYVDGAYNRMWGNMPGGYHDTVPPSVYANHRNPVLAYQGTIDLGNPVDNGEATMGATERAAWFNDWEAAGANTGFTYARIDGNGDRASAEIPVTGGDRINDGLHADPLLGGNGARDDLGWNNAVWPNVATLEVREDGQALPGGRSTLVVGEQLQLRYVYLDFDSACTVEIYTDIDRNPYNGQEALLSTQNHAATGETLAENIVDWDTTGWDTGQTFYVFTKVTDGEHVRYFYAPAGLLFRNPAEDWSGSSGCGANRPPVPDAGPDQTVHVGERVFLDGSGSYDPDEGVPPNTVLGEVDPKYVHQRRGDLKFQWTIAVLYYNAGIPVLAVPGDADIAATMQDFDCELASFVPNTPGVYQFDLFLTDDFGVALSDRVAITCLPRESDPDPVETTFSFERFIAYPSPANEEVHFGFIGQGEAQSIKVSVFDLSGRRVWQGSADNADELTWDGRDKDGVLLAPGAYLYTIVLVADGAAHSGTGTVFMSR